MIKIIIILYLIYLFSIKQKKNLYCGLFGFTGQLPANPYKIKIGLLDNMSRGSHSTGLWSGDSAMTLKAVEDAESFIERPEVKEYSESKNVIAHTRYATTGAKTTENAHPFFFPEAGLVGSHNGWLINETLDQIAKENKLEVPEVDSKLIYQVLIKNNMDFDCLSTIPGTMALAFHHKGLMYLYRRPSKPLFIGESEEGVYYSSKRLALSQIDCKGIWELLPNKMYVFEDGLMVDKFDVPESYLNSMPLDCSPSNWRQNVSRKEMDELANDFDLTSFCHKKTFGNCNSHVNQSSVVKDRFVYLDPSFYDEIVRGRTDDESKWIGVKVFSSGGKDMRPSECNELNYCKVRVEGREYWTKNGITDPIEINSYTNKVKIEVCPAQGNKDIWYYTKEIEIKDSTVMEVAVFLPFLSEEEEKIQGSDKGIVPSEDTIGSGDISSEREGAPPWEDVPVFFDEPEAMLNSFSKIIRDGNNIVRELTEALDVGAEDESMRMSVHDAISYMDSLLEKFEDAAEYLSNETKIVYHEE